MTEGHTTGEGDGKGGVVGGGVVAGGGAVGGSVAGGLTASTIDRWVK